MRSSWRESGEVDAVTFAPLNKAALHAGGWHYPDEHKMFAHLLEHQGYFSEMNVLDNQWMSRVTSHVSLREALDLITPKSIEDSIVPRPTARCGAPASPRRASPSPRSTRMRGEDGLFGREEIELIAPTVRKVAATGIDCRGPFPADTLYIRALRKGEFDGVVSMYHDQGQIATKLHGFNRGVTVDRPASTTIFTTPAHGTAFDIVGKGVANTGAMESALHLAARLASGAQRAAELAA